jgi:hypothetical protein
MVMDWAIHYLADALVKQSVPGLDLSSIFFGAAIESIMAQCL